MKTAQNPELKIHMIALAVSDLSKSLSFYKDGLGWQVQYSPGQKIAFLKTNSITIELFLNLELQTDSIDLIKERARQNMNQILLAHNAKSIHEVDSLLLKVEHSGGHILKVGTETAWGGYHGYFCDPDSHCWVITFWDQWKYMLDGLLI